MNIFVYSDESGVLDKAHNEIFVFGGLLFLSKEDKDLWSRKYLKAEKTIRTFDSKLTSSEVKATTISNKSKSKLYRSLNQVEKFGIVVHQQKLLDHLFLDKKAKQRYLDWAYKFSIRRKFEKMISDGAIIAAEVENIFFFVDEHSTATNGIYELKESLEQEFKRGTYSANWMQFHKPIFPNLKTLEVKYCNSATTTLVRAADIIANNLYFHAINSRLEEISKPNFTIEHHPKDNQHSS